MSASDRADTGAGFEAIAQYFLWLACLPDTPRVFRGHARTDWNLVPSAGRPDRRGITTQKQLNQWKRRAGPVLDHAPVSEIEWLVLAQHYQVATPLLDWTSSPLAALYFACASYESDWGHIYAMPIAPFAEFDSHVTIDPFGPTEPQLILLPTDSMNVRAKMQRSWMTLHRPASTNAWTDGREREEGHLGRQIQMYAVDAAQKLAVQTALSTLGFDHVSMMSDIQSAAVEFRRDAGDA